MEQGDHFGFILQNSSYVNQQQLFDKMKQERARIDKWRYILVDWKAYQKKNYRKMKRKIRKGIPDIFKSYMWLQLTQTVITENLYEQCLSQKCTEITENEILRDIGRTFPRHLFFKEKAGFGQKQLFNVLRSLACYFPEIGYCQGQGFIAALLLMHMDEDQAFSLMCNLIKSEKYMMHGLFQSPMPELNKWFYKANSLLKTHLPKLYEHFMRQNVLVSMYASQWFITVYSNSFPLDVVTRIWDIYLSEGQKICFRVYLALLKLMQEDLLKMSFESIMSLLRSYAQSVKGEKLITTALKFSITKKQLQEIDREYENNPKEIFKIW